MDDSKKAKIGAVTYLLMIVLLVGVFVVGITAHTIPYQEHYNITYSYITGTVIALENNGYGTKAVLNGDGFITLSPNTQLLVGRTYNFIYENYALKIDTGWNRFWYTRSPVLVRYELQ